MDIKIPDWVKIKNYRTMTDEKKKLAVEGVKKYQLEWMNEEINEFYEAVDNGNKREILDEAIGLIRTVQQFVGSKRVVRQWEKVANDVRKVLANKGDYEKAFKRWKKRKTAKGQAKGVEAVNLEKFGKLYKKK